MGLERWQTRWTCLPGRMRASGLMLRLGAAIDCLCDAVSLCDGLPPIEPGSTNSCYMFIHVFEYTHTHTHTHIHSFIHVLCQSCLVPCTNAIRGLTQTVK